ncbi:hypothetical protein [Arthrobacter dokdonensis]|uniref:hypothetical protein n=1 Tax=Arthrobacter dokdonellae TaxID=2211210 RepID=UPI000DE5BDC4|nr:hypothetical protein [Arthrobacter dokdonellae]
MSAINEFVPSRRSVRIHRASIISLLAAASLFLVSAVLQLVASLQRWVAFSGSRAPEDLSVEDHVFDYYFPWEDWEPIGTTAQFFGTGILVQSLGIVAMAVGVLVRPGAAALRVTALALTIIESVLVLLVAATFGVVGAHALVSGVTGAASPLQHSESLFRVLTLVGFAGLIALAALWQRRLRAAMAACLFLIGSSLVGYVIATYMIAPVFAGGTSHDTTPGTETVVAASTAAAGIAMLFAVRAVARRRAGPA